MSSNGTITLAAIRQMLEHCAPGYTWVEKTHNIVVRYAGRTFPSLPRGEHGRRGGDTEIQVGKVKQMVRQLGIEGCAKEQIERLR